MARRPRVHFPGALFHVISRGNQRQRIYKDDEDHRRFETLLGQAVKRHALKLYAYGDGVRHDFLDNLSFVHSAINSS